MSKRPRRKRERRTQAERTAETRKRLIEATIETLSKEGYSGTSTTAIVRRAGVSRGAQVHHFPTKSDLVVAAVKQLNDDRLDEFRSAFAKIPDGVEPGAAALEILWPMFNGPSFQAWVELVIASRTRPDLRKKLRDVGSEFEDGVDEIFRDSFPGLSRGSALAAFLPTIVFALLQGLALRHMVNSNDPQIPAVLATLKASSAGLLAQADTDEDQNQGGTDDTADPSLEVAGR